MKRRITVHEVEEELKKAKTLEEKITLLQKMLSAIPKNKATEEVRADILRRIAKLKDRLMKERKVRAKIMGRRKGISKEAPIMVSLFSFPNTYKSWFLNKYAG